MTQNPAPESVALTSLPEDCAEALASFCPRSLPNENWFRMRADVVALVAGARPDTVAETRGLCSALCELLAAELVERPDACVAEALTEVALSRHVTVLKRSNAAATVHVKSARLSRLFRVLNGLPEPTRKPAEPTEAPGPFTEADLERLVNAVSAAPAGVRVAVHHRLVCGLAAGIIDSAADALSVNSSDGRVSAVKDAHGTALPLSDVWVQALARLGVESVAGGECWQKAVAWLREHEAAVESRQLRDAWLVDGLSQQGSPAQLLRRHSVTGRDMQRVMGHLPRPEETALTGLLRG